MIVIADKASQEGRCKTGVGVVRDKEVKLEDGEASQTLGGAGEGVLKEREVNRRRFFLLWTRKPTAGGTERRRHEGRKLCGYQRSELGADEQEAQGQISCFYFQLGFPCPGS